MKVCLIIPELAKGGPDRVFYHLALGLREVEDLSLLTFKPGGHYWDKLSEVMPVKTLDTQKRYPMKEYKQFLKEHKPDVVLATQNGLLVTAFSKMFSRNKPTLILRPANHLTRNAKELIRKSPVKHLFSLFASILAMHLAKMVICQSQDLFDDFKRYGISKRKLVIISNPVYLPEKSVSTGHGNKGLKLLAIGRLTNQKGFDLLVEAMKGVVAQRADVQLTILGEGPDEAALQAQIATNGLEEHVTLAGYQSTVKPYIMEADFLVSSSRYEGFPNVVLEALSYGLPVLATRSPGGTSMLVREGLSGVICENESVSGLTDIMVKANPMDYSSERIRSFVKENFSLSHITSQYQEAIKSIFIK